MSETGIGEIELIEREEELREVPGNALDNESALTPPPARATPRNGGRPKATKSILKEISAENVEILSVSGIERDSTGQELITLNDTNTNALAMLAERRAIESQLNSVYYLATNVTAINDRGQLLLYNPMAALKAIELLIDIKGLRDMRSNRNSSINVYANAVRSIDLKSKS